MNHARENVLVFCLSVLAYSGVATAPFMYDDIPAIKKNPDVQGVTPYSQIWRNDFWGVPIVSNTSHKSYRPLTVTTFRLIRTIFGDWSTPYHVTNILLHAWLSVMFTSLCRRMVFCHVTGHASLLAGILFSLHPVHTEAVSGVVGMAELLSSFFFFSALILQSTKPTTEVKRKFPSNRNAPGGKQAENTHLRYRGKTIRSDPQPAETTKQACVCTDEGNSRLNLACSLLLAGCAMICKESGITVLGVVGANEVVKLLEISECSQHYRRWKNRAKVTMAPLFIWFLCLMWFRLWVMGWTTPVFAEPDNPASYSEYRLTRFLTYSWLCCVNFWLLFFPSHLCYDWSYGTISLVTSLSDIRNFASLLFFSCLVGGIYFIIYKLNRKNGTFRPAVMGISLMVLPFLPASNLLFPVGFVVAERILYLPSSGFVVLLSFVLNTGFNWFPSRRNLYKGVVIIVIVLYGIRTTMRNQVWISREAFMSAGVVDCPNNAKVHYNWGNYLYEHNRTLDAAVAYQKAIDFYPRFISAINNLATILEEDPNTLDKAHELYVLIIHLHPHGSNAYNNFASLLLKREQYEHAFRVTSRGIAMAGADNIPAAGPVARALVKQGKLAQAERLYHVIFGESCVTDLELIRLDGCEGVNVTLLNDFGFMLEMKGKMKQAESLYTNIHELHPSNTDSLVQLANLFVSVDKFVQAEKAILRAIEIDPEETRRAWALASSLFNVGKLRESLKLYEKIIPMIPGNLEVSGQYAAVLFEAGMEEKAEEIFENLTNRDTECKFDQAWRNFAGLRGKQRRFNEGILLLKSCANRIEGSQVVTSEDKVRCATVRLLLAKHEKLQAYRHKESGDKTAAKRLWIDAMHNLEKVIALDPTLKAASKELNAMRS